MQTFNRIASAIMGALLAPFGEEKNWSAWIDVIFWSVAGGIVALLVYKYCSNQKGIERAKNDIKVHLLEVRLFKDDILGVFASTGKILAKNAVYLGHNLMPMVVMMVPMMAILIQLVSLYGFKPVDTGSTQMFVASLDGSHPAVAAGDLRATDIELELPPGVVVEVGPVRTAQGVHGPEIAWHLRADTPGNHVLKLHAGDQVIEKGFAVGGDASLRVPVMRTKSWEALLFPAEDPMPADAPLYSAKLKYPNRDLGWMPGGELGILVMFFVLSIVAGLALKGVFGVTL